MLTGHARPPEGMRLYAIGDIHGCDTKLKSLHEAIAVDLRARPPWDYRIVHVGDYADRGPDSAGVVARLVAMQADPHVVCLRGNHDEMWRLFLDNQDHAAVFLRNGGKDTIRSYGVSNRSLNYAALAAATAAAMPAEHRAFLDNLPLTAQFGDYLFVHAGVRPGIPLDAQAAEDLMWIREDFLLDPHDLGVVVVHGHTVTTSMQPEIHPNRIAIDTGAVFGGALTCVVLEDTDVRFMGA